MGDKICWKPSQGFGAYAGNHIKISGFNSKSFPDKKKKDNLKNNQ